MKDIQFIDVEASGLHLDSYPIEVAILSAANAVLDFYILPVQQLLTARQLETFNLVKRQLAENKSYRLHRAASDVMLLTDASPERGCRLRAAGRPQPWVKRMDSIERWLLQPRAIADKPISGAVPVQRA
jgi:hypothetical protein